ncbi:MAG: leucyl aminopeptidase [Sphingomonadaceae bacterium]|nr:leucyl aminopeptidase [Sphingomonadaceae bacterium]
MYRHVIALALASIATPTIAQTIVGSGIEPGTTANSQVRPVDFATQIDRDGVLVILTDGTALPEMGLDAGTAAAVRAAIAAAKFEGKAESSLTLRGIGSYARIQLVGTMGDGDKAIRLRDAGGKAAQDLKDEAYPVSIAGNLSASDAASVALGYNLGQYRFDRYKTVGKTAPPVQKVTIVTNDPRAAETEWNTRGRALADGVTLSRDLATEPANVIYPESFVARVRTAFAGVPGVKIEVLDEPAMRRMNMGSIVGVGQGSRRPSRIMLVEYSGGSGAPLAFVGKGITFDSGGISLKPGSGMWEMKSDMSGAASVMGAALSLAKSRAPVNVIAVAALAENMPGGNAQRPGDVVRTMSGKTIEILNTDAEGRLVLADANEYVATKKPAGIVNIATLTGSIVQALNDEYAGLFARDEGLARALAAAGTVTGEEVWRMPLHKNHKEDLKSDIADIKNVVEGGGPGASLGATFIGYFVDEATPWAHLDIAGVNWADKAGPVTPKGASGWGVRLLDQLARNWKAE